MIDRRKEEEKNGMLIDWKGKRRKIFFFRDDRSQLEIIYR
jgi:hypothetical protein